jgi:glycerol-3-phosphate dehydrogenase (NAD(P)+)
MTPVDTPAAFVLSIQVFRRDNLSMKRVAILGAGGMGTALALLFARRGLSVRLWARNEADASAMARTRENSKHLPGVKIPMEIGITSNACDATEAADLIVAAIPSAYLRSSLASIAERVPLKIPVLSVIKGIENETLARPSRIIVETLGPRPVAILSGPSHAEELARGLPASLVVAGEDEALNVAIRDALNGGSFRVYTNPDAIGVELAGALKNVLGIAAGICDGLGFGDNAKAALVTRGLVEMSRFAVDQGGHPSTFYGMAGVGDVLTTCYSPFGRNRSVGEKLGRGMTLDQILQGMNNVAEGVTTARSLHEWARQRGVAMPIADEVYRILFEAKSPLDAVTALMERDPKDER